MPRNANRARGPMANAISRPYPALSGRLSQLSAAPLAPASSHADISGVSVSVSRIAPTMAPVMVNAMGRKMRPSTCWNVKIGTRATMKISFENSIGRPSRVASWRASWAVDASGGLASFVTRMASTMTTAASTRMPKSTAPKLSRLAGTSSAQRTT